MQELWEHRGRGRVGRGRMWPEKIHKVYPEQQVFELGLQDA